MRAALAVELPLRALFEAPTVAALAAAIASTPPSALRPPLRAQPRAGAAPLSFAQQRLWFINQLQPESWSYNEPIALRLSGPLHQAALEATLDTLVQRHETLRTIFPLLNGQPVQVILERQSQPLQVIDISDLPVEQRTTEAERCSSYSMSRSSAPRCCVWRPTIMLCC